MRHRRTTSDFYLLCYARYTLDMKTVSHRELRNSSGAVLKSVAAGESYTVTNDGTPVARLIPPSAPAIDLRCTRRATIHGGFGELTRYRIAETVEDALTDLRRDR